jgi:hypothetical protein
MRRQRETLPDEEPLLSHRQNKPPKEKRTWQTRTLSGLALMGQASSPWAMSSVYIFY